MESLTMEDMDTYSMISQRIVTDDVLTIVDSYFMPYGIECDQYNVLGEILDIMKFKNILTGEEICQMTIESNDIQFDVCINSKDLLGEPASWTPLQRNNLAAGTAALLTFSNFFGRRSSSSMSC